MKRKISIRSKVLMIFILLVAIRFFVPTWTPSIKGYENSISILKQIEINGSKHEVMIRGNDKNNPVLIFVHGGPGCPEIYYVRKYQDLLEQNFTIVRYDQRGAGKSYQFSEDYSDLSIKLLVDDLLALTDYVSKELETDDIILAGHSFGTIVGIKAAYQAPEKYKGYIGIGQVGDFWVGELEALDYCLSQAIAQNNSSDINAIEAYRENTIKHLEQFPRKYVWRYGGAVRLINEKVDMVTGLLFNPEYNLSDSIRYAKGLFVSDHRLWKEIIQSNLPQEVPELKIPCYFVTGKYDHLTPIKTANQYFNTIIAPTKEFVVFDDSAHFPQFEEKENFFTFINSLHFFIGEEY
ncbi:alpha/beta fold hydrolase [Desulfosporosinus sp. BICA1-9]|uniref:alpha/beta fold hydrolase n=1 Tax=Desulfosporosinus sp. BICA1-9 TaxID=1531958 RepID=UPI00054BD619|nr:alpha/beta hydrolase [Desulfosporosinus sp. BICA1-9]KJS89187.1 MAG: alpha/beta hydrolase [Desulfosporosinus sp. BICA1-9]HBW34063.1 alpha/beta hydrolase [Desulfosporosinus sp.]